MENVVEFPTKSVRDWLLIERTMAAEFTKLGLSEAIKERLSENMKAFYKVMDHDFRFSFDAELPSTISKDQARAIFSSIGNKTSVVLGEQIHAFTNKLFFDRLHREIEVCGELGLL